MVRRCSKLCNGRDSLLAIRAQFQWVLNGRWTDREDVGVLLHLSALVIAQTAETCTPRVAIADADGIAAALSSHGLTETWPT